MPIESVYYESEQVQAKADDDMNLKALREKMRNLAGLTAPRGIDALSLLAVTNGQESWYGAEIDKSKYRIVLEDETEDSVYLKLVKIQQEKK